MNGAERPPPALSDKVQFLPGVGPWRADLMARLGIETVGDLLEHFPARHERQTYSTIEKLDEGMTATVMGRVTKVRAQRFGRRPSCIATVVDNTGRCSLRWFNAAWMEARLAPGQFVRATGKVRHYQDQAQLVNPRVTVLEDDDATVLEAERERFEPVYPATAEISSRFLARLIGEHLERLLPLVEEMLPAAWLKAREFVPRPWAVRMMHRPARRGDAALARRRLAYDELLLMQLAIAIMRRYRRAGPAAPVMRVSKDMDRRIRRRFPFELTAGQERAIGAITADLAAGRPMNRLLQGDVGCGKTVVALYAALVAIAHKRQVAIMAPTELLAEQHHRSMTAYLRGSRVRIGLLTGRLGSAERSRMHAAIRQGEIDLVIGTHALIQKDVVFASLGLAIVDEQHRFGVRQRAIMRGKGVAVHYLVMTATPIPRTMALTVFGDMDVTTIDGLPPGRAPIRTRVVGASEVEDAWRFVRERVEAGEQAYVVYPLIDESDKQQLRAATTEFERLRDTVFAGQAVGLLHGRLPAEERTVLMAAFAAGEVAVLVATTVVEVGIDVPSATCMVIEHADRYGLSQLHQLRGRVGRGAKPGYCLLMSDADDSRENERLRILASTTDGFRIADEDLRLRGPGEVLGTRQHGLPELRVADLLGDGELLRMALRDAQELVAGDPHLRAAEHAALRRALVRRYGETIRLMDVG